MRRSKDCVKIPSEVIVFYSNQKNKIVFKSILTQKLLHLKIRIVLFKSKQLIKVLSIPFFIQSNSEKRELKSIKGFTVACIKQLLNESFVESNCSLKLVGVGYKVFYVNNYRDLLFFKLGCSHPIYFKVAFNCNVDILKFVKLFILGMSYDCVSQMGSLIRLLKKPEPYKGKGVLYSTEKILLKEGKKI